MKKIFAVLSAISILFTFVSCGESAVEDTADSTVTQRQTRISSSPIDFGIIGTWLGETNGYRFQEDRKVSLVVDFSSVLRFSFRGTLIMGMEEIDTVDYDGSVINVTQKVDDTEDSETFDVITLERLDEPNPDSMNGEYQLTGGTYLDIIAESVGLDSEKVNIHADIDMEKEEFFITIVDYCDYETTGGNTLELFSDDMNYVDESANGVKYTYVIDGDTLTLTYEATGGVEVLQRQDEQENQE